MTNLIIKIPYQKPVRVDRPPKLKSPRQKSTKDCLNEIFPDSSIRFT